MSVYSSSVGTSDRPMSTQPVVGSTSLNSIYTCSVRDTLNDLMQTIGEVSLEKMFVASMGFTLLQLDENGPSSLM